jgi:hypothetical protein
MRSLEAAGCGGSNGDVSYNMIDASGH